MKLDEFETLYIDPFSITTSHHHKKSKKIHWLREIGLFALTMCISMVAGIMIMNFNLFKIMATDVLFPSKSQPQVKIAENKVVKNESEYTKIEISSLKPTTEEILKQERVKIPLVFNYLPPDNRVIIESKGIDAPIVDIIAYTPDKLIKGDFHKELSEGVVRYPNTPTPEKKGNLLIMGHSSDYVWNRNPFAQVFAKIPNLDNGSIIKVLRRGQLYEYTVKEKVIVKPESVNKEYLKRTDGHYLTLMACYPLATSLKRILVVAEQRKNLQDNFDIAYNATEQSSN